jgi:hypothetical protein
MSAQVFIYGDRALWWRDGFDVQAGLSKLEIALGIFLQDAGEVIWDEDEHFGGPSWSVGFLLYDHAHVQNWVQRLVIFLRQWGVPAGTSLSVTTYPERAGAGMEHGTVDVLARDAPLPDW